MGNKKSKVRVMPLEVIDESDPCYYVGDTIEKKVDGKKQIIRSGKGKQTWIDNSVYIGRFNDDCMNGYGTINYPDGSIYVGEWKNNVRHGRGKLINVDGSSYEGEWKFDEQHGMGRFFYQNGDYYTGEFKLNTMCGEGALFNSNKQKVYSGGWFNNQFHGKGVYYFTNGKEQFNGNWSQSLAHGIGIHYNFDGSIRQFGVFENGEFFKDLVEDIYNVLQYHIDNDEYVYNYNEEGETEIDTEVVDWVTTEYVSPVKRRIGVDYGYNPHKQGSAAVDVDRFSSNEGISHRIISARSVVDGGKDVVRCAIDELARTGGSSIPETPRSYSIPPANGGGGRGSGRGRGDGIGIDVPSPSAPPESRKCSDIRMLNRDDVDTDDSSVNSNNVNGASKVPSLYFGKTQPSPHTHSKTKVVVQNPLMKSLQKNAFLFNEEDEGYSNLPRVAHKIIQQSIANNEFTSEVPTLPRLVASNRQPSQRNIISREGNKKRGLLSRMFGRGKKSSEEDEVVVDNPAANILLVKKTDVSPEIQEKKKRLVEIRGGGGGGGAVEGAEGSSGNGSGRGGAADGVANHDNGNGLSPQLLFSPGFRYTRRAMRKSGGEVAKNNPLNVIHNKTEFQAIKPRGDAGRNNVVVRKNVLNAPRGQRKAVKAMVKEIERGNGVVNPLDVSSMPAIPNELVGGVGGGVEGDANGGAKYKEEYPNDKLSQLKGEFQTPQPLKNMIISA